MPVHLESEDFEGEDLPEWLFEVGELEFANCCY